MRIMKIGSVMAIIGGLLSVAPLLAANTDRLDDEAIELYFKRLDLPQDTIKSPIDHDLLNRLIQAHLVAIPFENLNMHADPKRPVVITLAAIKDKILRHKNGQYRGGYCYEVNELLFQLLKHLKLDVKRHKASVWAGKEPGKIPWPSHQLSTVTLGDSMYLVDVGFGLFNIFQAVKLPRDLRGVNTFTDSRGKIIQFEKVNFDDSFGSELSGHDGYIYKRWSESKRIFERISTFSLQEFQASDFNAPNDYVQNSYEPFLDNVMHTRFSNDGNMITCVKLRSTFAHPDAILQWINSENKGFHEISL